MIMVVATVDYGSFKTHIGTIAEVAGAMKGKDMKKSHIFYNGTNMTGIESK